MSNYECHVTTKIPENTKQFEAVAERYGWTTSIYDGDPKLGKGPRFYFTCHGKNRLTMFLKMKHLEDALGSKVLQSKIEKEIYYKNHA